MPEITRLVDSKTPALGHGAVFRCPAKWPYENVVDFMVFENPLTDRSFGLMVTTGMKAGLILVLLPEDCKTPEPGVHGLSTQWVVANWAEWIYPECPVDQVLLLDHYPSASLE